MPTMKNATPKGRIFCLSSSVLNQYASVSAGGRHIESRLPVAAISAVWGWQRTGNPIASRLSEFPDSETTILFCYENGTGLETGLKPGHRRRRANQLSSATTR